MNLVGDEPRGLIFGETPAGIMIAVRAVRNDPTIVSRRDYFGGMLANGICVFDTLYSSDSRSPLLSDILSAFRYFASYDASRSTPSTRLYDGIEARTVTAATTPPSKSVQGSDR